MVSWRVVGENEGRGNKENGGQRHIARRDQQELWMTDTEKGIVG